jgi:DNA repair protein RadA/Sms
MSYICTNCEAEFLKWSGKCSNCDEWGTLEEQESSVSTVSSNGEVNASSYKSIAETVKNTSSKNKVEYRITTSFNELDRVLGGGIVPGEVILLSGEPGIGKSTLLMQVLLNFLKENKVLYICGEESPDQLYSRLERLSGGKNIKGIENFLLGLKY